jgi:BolA protein
MNHCDTRLDLIRNALSVLSPLELDIQDESSLHEGHAGAKVGGHFVISLTSALFEGKTSVKRHQMIYTALGNLLKTDIHAISIQAKAPSEL